MSFPHSAARGAGRDAHMGGVALPAGAAGTSKSRPTVVAVLTVIGWNALLLAALWTATASAARSADDSTGGFDGLVAAIIAVIGAGAILFSCAIGVTVAAVQAKSRRPPMLGTGPAILAGTRAASWGLLVLVPVTLLFVHP